MIAKDVDDRIAVGNYITLKIPLAAKLVLQQKLIHTSRLAVDAVVSAHHGSSFSLGDSRSERRQIGVQLIVLADGYIRFVSCALGATVYGVVFGRRNGTIIFWIVTLHAGDKSNPQASCQKRVFSISFLSAPPTWIAEYVNVRRPQKITTHKKTIVFCVFLSFDVFNSSFNARRDCHAVNSIGVESSSQSNGLRECGDAAVVRHTV